MQISPSSFQPSITLKAGHKTLHNQDIPWLLPAWQEPLLSPDKHVRLMRAFPLMGSITLWEIQCSKTIFSIAIQQKIKKKPTSSIQVSQWKFRGGKEWERTILRHTQESPSEFTSLNLTWKQFLVMAYPWKGLAFVIEIPKTNGLKLIHFT